MKPNFTDAAIALYLVIGFGNILRLLSIDQMWTTSAAVAILYSGFLGGYILADRFNERKRIRQIVQSELGQRAIAAFAQKPGYDNNTAEKMVVDLCMIIPSEQAEVMLKAMSAVDSDG